MKFQSNRRCDVLSTTFRAIPITPLKMGVVLPQRSDNMLKKHPILSIYTKSYTYSQGLGSAHLKCVVLIPKKGSQTPKMCCINT